MTFMGFAAFLVIIGIGSELYKEVIRRKSVAQWQAVEDSADKLNSLLDLKIAAEADPDLGCGRTSPFIDGVPFSAERSPRELRAVSSRARSAP